VAGRGSLANAPGQRIAALDGSADGGDKPRTQVIESDDADVREARFEGGKQVRIPLNFSYNNEGFPSELNLFLEQRQSGKEGFVRLTWHRPNGETINLGGQRIGEKERVSISQNSSLEGRLGMVPT